MLKELSDFIGAIPANPALRAKAELLTTKMDGLNDRVHELEKENGEMRKSVDLLRTELQRYKDLDQYIEYKGALFKKKNNGGLHEALYCPKCRHSCAPTATRRSYECKGCNWISDGIGPGNISTIIAEAAHEQHTRVVHI